MNEGWKVAIVQSLQCALLCISRVGTAMQNSLREQEAADSGRQSDKRSQCRANCKVCVTEHNKHPETNTRKQTPGNKHPETNDRSWAIRRESVSPASPQCSLTVASLLDYMTACFWARMTIPSTGFLPSVLRHSISLQWSLNPESRRHVSMYCLSWLYRP